MVNVIKSNGGYRVSDLNMPEIIPVGTQGWKIRDAERIIIEIVNRSTTPQSGWAIRQKLKSKKKYWSLQGEQLCSIMFSLNKRGYLEHMGFDSDSDSIYKIPTKKEI